MDKQKNGELSRMFGYAGKFHVLTVLGCVLSGISTILSMLPFVCIWLVIRDLIQAFAAGDISLATGSAHYAWMAVVFAAASILIYFIALNCTHLAAFRTATNMRKSAIHHIVTLPLGYFSQNASGRLRKIIDDNAGLTEGFLAHQLPDLTGAAVMPVAVIILIFLFDWRLGICCLIPMGISVIFLKQMMGGDTVIVESISRFARNTRDLLDLVERLTAKGVEFVSKKEAIDTTTPTGKFMLTIFGAVAELEREYILQRQREGIAIAKKQGKYIGRKAKQPPDFDYVVGQWQRGEISAVEAMRILKMSKTTFYRKSRQLQLPAPSAYKESKIDH